MDNNKDYHITRNERDTISVINGPNINMLGIREPQYYGRETLSDIEENLNSLTNKLSINLLIYQSNHEGEIVDFIQHNIHKVRGIVINPAAFSKTGYSILEALTCIEIPFVEVHLSNIFSRELWHSESIFSSKAIGTITGFKGFSYELGVRAILNYINYK